QTTPRRAGSSKGEFRQAGHTLAKPTEDQLCKARTAPPPSPALSLKNPPGSVDFVPTFTKVAPNEQSAAICRTYRGRPDRRGLRTNGRPPPPPPPRTFHPASPRATPGIR